MNPYIDGYKNTSSFIAFLDIPVILTNSPDFGVD
jgi:hypothetical protein